MNNEPRTKNQNTAAMSAKPNSSKLRPRVLAGASQYRAIDLNAFLAFIATIPPKAKARGSPIVSWAAYQNGELHVFADYYLCTAKEDKSVQFQAFVGDLDVMVSPPQVRRLRKGLRAPRLARGVWYLVTTTATGTAYDAVR